MREIKFRAWDKTKKIVREIKHLSWDENNLIAYCDPRGHNFSEYFSVVLNGWDYQIMQYTGLKDKNGTEIYEGDICWNDFQEVHGKVVFEDGGYRYVWDNIMEDLDEACDYIEIVSNIFENPELLEV